ncbi:hypothetical protein SAMN06265795_116120 [Noviherbaspirillum humi]|uniref:Uncharacterized protein n=1 Tax=Noviherbaspirillum humi TaxID=1688639 RepID=A0A239KND0_9BURK|nr:hypothetical protein SAMN06265795_116120 [Noviherbaspirillum humi]
MAWGELSRKGFGRNQGYPPREERKRPFTLTFNNEPMEWVIDDHDDFPWQNGLLFLTIGSLALNLQTTLQN